ncbi:MAG: transporter substrate-binding domain-containing protein [Cognaticolwellia sp.]
MTNIRQVYLSFIFLSLYSSTALCSYTQGNPLIFVAEELPPYHFINSDGHVSGALVEVVQAILDKAELPGKIEIQPFARVYKNTQTQQNTFMFSMLKTPNREAKFQWVGQTYKSTAVLVGLKNRQDIKLLSLESAKPYIVGTIRGYHSDNFLHENGFSEKENLSLSVTSKHLWAMLFNQRIDLVLTNYMALDREIKQSGFDSNEITPYLSLPNFPSELYIATGLTTPNEVIERLATALAAIKKSGVYQQILTKYDL